MNTLLSIMQHALGRDEYGRPKSKAGTDYRNHFCAGPGSPDYDLCVDAVVRGYMRANEPSEMSGGDWVFTATLKGKEYVAEASPVAPPISRGKRRYATYLNSAAADNGVRFGDWLKAGAR